MYSDATILSFDEWREKIKQKLEENIKFYNQNKDRVNKKRKREDKKLEINNLKKKIVI